MTVDGNSIRCDAYGCRIESRVGFRPPGAPATLPEDICMVRNGRLGIEIE